MWLVSRSLSTTWQYVESVPSFGKYATTCLSGRSSSSAHRCFASSWRSDGATWRHLHEWHLCYTPAWMMIDRRWSRGVQKGQKCWSTSKPGDALVSSRHFWLFGRRIDLRCSPSCLCGSLKLLSRAFSHGKWPSVLCPSSTSRDEPLYLSRRDRIPECSSMLQFCWPFLPGPLSLIDSDKSNSLNMCLLFWWLQSRLRWLFRSHARPLSTSLIELSELTKACAQCKKLGFLPRLIPH